MTKTESEIMSMLAIDWLQWSDKFDEHRAEVTLNYISQLKAENARLREALESISGIYNDEDEPSKGYAGNIAREALKGKE